jgi:plasmid maintenance system antidote protein VapI
MITVREMLDEVILDAGGKSQAAKVIGVHRNTVRNIIEGVFKMDYVTKMKIRNAYLSLLKRGNDE